MAPDRAGDANVLERLLGAVTCTLSSCGSYAFPPGWSIPERALEVHVGYVCLDGELAVRFDADDPARIVASGEVLLTRPGQAHGLANPGPGPVRLLTVHFSARIHDVLDMPAIYGLPGHLRPSAAGLARIDAAVRDMLDVIDERAPGSALEANAACARFVAALWRQAVEADGGQPALATARARDVVRLAPVFRLIHERYAERPTVAQLAAEVHLEPDHFATIFRRVTGRPPHAYVSAYRLQRVRTLLAATDEPIGEIAARTGFTDSFYLARAFRRAYGMPPSAYRKTRTSPDLP